MSEYAELKGQAVIPLHLQTAEPAKKHPACNKIDNHGDGEDADEFRGVEYPERDDAANIHDSMVSVVGETQYTGIELDSQARESDIDLPLPGPMYPPASWPAKTANQEIGPTQRFFKVPAVQNINDIGSSFTYGVPPTRKSINTGPERQKFPSSSEGGLATAPPPSLREPRHGHANNSPSNVRTIAPSTVSPGAFADTQQKLDLQQAISIRPSEEFILALAMVPPHVEEQKQQTERRHQASTTEEQPVVQIYLPPPAIQSNNATPKSGRKDSSSNSRRNTLVKKGTLRSVPFQDVVEFNNASETLLEKSPNLTAHHNDPLAVLAAIPRPPSANQLLENPSNTKRLRAPTPIENQKSNYPQRPSSGASMGSSKHGLEQSFRSNISNAHNEYVFEPQHIVPKDGIGQGEQDAYPLGENDNIRIFTEDIHNPAASSDSAREDGMGDVSLDNEIADTELKVYQGCPNSSFHPREPPNPPQDLDPALQNPEKSSNLTPLFQHPSIPNLGSQSRPQSRHSTHGRSMTRPVTSGTLHLQDACKLRIHHSPNPSKVIKSRLHSKRTEMKSLVEKLDGNPQQSAQSMTKRDKALTILQESLEEQDATIKEREAEVEALNTENATAYESIRSLEKAIEEQREQNELLGRSLSHLKEQSSRYKQHANDVSKAQRFVKTEAAKLKETQQALAQEAKVQTERDKEMVERIKQAQASVRELQAMSEQSNKLQMLNEGLAAANKQFETSHQNLQMMVQSLERENQVLQLEISTSQQTSKRLENQLVDTKTKLDKAKKELEISDDELQRLVAAEQDHQAAYDALRVKYEMAAKGDEANKLRIADLEKHLQDEKQNLGQLQKALSEPNALYKELADEVKKTPKAVANNLQAVLDRLSAPLKAIQTKVNELAMFINEQPTPSPKPSEDACTRLEKEKADVVRAIASFQDLVKKFPEVKKEILDQLRVSKEVETQFQSRIAELAMKEQDLLADKRDSEHKFREVTKRLEEQRLCLESNQEQSSTKIKELEAALAHYNGNTQLQDKLRDLENANTALKDQFEVANRNYLKAKQDLESHQEMVSNDQRILQTTNQELVKAQERIAALKSEFEADKENAIKETTKVADKAKANLKMKHTGTVNTMQRNFEEQEQKLKKVQEVCRDLEAENNAFDISHQTLEGKAKALEAKTVQQAAEIESLKQRLSVMVPREQFEEEICSLSNNIAELKSNIQMWRNKGGEDIGNLQGQIEQLQGKKNGPRKTNPILKRMQASVHTNYDTAQKRSASIPSLDNQPVGFSTQAPPTNLGKNLSSGPMHLVKLDRRDDEIYDMQMTSPESALHANTNIHRPKAAVVQPPEQNQQAGSATRNRATNTSSHPASIDTSQCSVPTSRKVADRSTSRYGRVNQQESAQSSALMNKRSQTLETGFNGTTNAQTAPRVSFMNPSTTFPVASRVVGEGMDNLSGEPMKSRPAEECESASISSSKSPKMLKSALRKQNINVPLSTTTHKANDHATDEYGVVSGGFTPTTWHKIPSDAASLGPLSVKGVKTGRTVTSNSTLGSTSTVPDAGIQSQHEGNRKPASTYNNTGNKRSGAYSESTKPPKVRRTSSRAISKSVTVSIVPDSQGTSQGATQ